MANNNNYITIGGKKYYKNQTQNKTSENKKQNQYITVGGRKYYKNGYIEEENEDYKKTDGYFKKSKAFADNNENTTFGEKVKDTAQTTVGTLGDATGNFLKGMLGIGEKAVDLVTYGAAGVASWFGADDKAQEWKANAQKDWTSNFLGMDETGMDDYSVLGDKSDAVVEGVGYYGGMVALQSIGVPWQVTAGVSSMGSGLSEAFNEGASTEDAIKSALIGAVAEVGSEYLFSGLGALKGTGALDDAVVGKLTKGIKNRFIKNLAQYGLKSAGEGVEEIASGWVSEVGKRLTYLKDEEKSVLKNAWEGTKDYWTQQAAQDFWAGTLVSAISGVAIPGGGNIVNNIETGRSVMDNLTENEEKVLETEIENRFNKELEIKKDQNLSKRQINQLKEAISEQVMSDLQKGKISIESIENTLGKDGVNTKKRFGKDADSYLINSYNNEYQKTQRFQYETTNDEIANNVYEKAQAKELNNSVQTHEVVDLGVKVAKELNANVDFTTTEEITNNLVEKTQNKLGRELTTEEINDIKAFASKQNGYKVGNDIVLNVDSNQAAAYTIGHEVKHMLEADTETNKALNEALKNYAIYRNSYNTDLEKLTTLYEGVENADVEGELMANYTAEFFTDEAFVSNLSTANPTVFQKIANFFKELYYKATNNKEKLLLKKINDTIQAAYSKTANSRKDINVDRSYKVYEKAKSNTTTETQNKADVETKVEDKVNLPTAQEISQEQETKPEIQENLPVIEEKIEQLEESTEKIEKQTKKIEKNTKKIEKTVEKLDKIVETLTEEAFAKSLEIAEKMKANLPTANKVKNIEGVENIKKKYDSANKIDGKDKTIVLANGEKLSGTYKLLEAGSVTASHNAETFEKTEGFPTTEKGTTVNDRDYQSDKNAQNLVNQKAKNYDGRAFADNGVIVTKDGIVVSGNDRTMSGDLAAKNNTDAAYIEYLKENAEQFGFTKEQIESMAHPRVVLELNSDVDYDTKTFAKFNKDSKKSKSVSEKAKEIGKTIDNNTITAVADVIDKFNSIDDLYNSEKATRDLINILQAKGIVDGNELSEIYNGSKFTGTGKDLVESVILGSVISEENAKYFSNNNDLKFKIMKVAPAIIQNKTLGDYSINEELNNAIETYKKASTSRLTINEYTNQYNIFGDNNVDLVTKRIAQLLETKGYKNLKNFIEKYNAMAEAPANGQRDIFSQGQVETKGDILNKALDINDETELIKYSLNEDNRGRMLSVGQENYFKDSKVRNKDGKLLTMFHGTTQEFTVFDKSKIGKNTHNEGLFGKGFYFTEAESLADNYRRLWETGNVAPDGVGRVMETYLNITNPFYWNSIKTEEQMKQFAKENNIPDGVLEWNRTGGEIHVFTEAHQSRAFTEALQKAGYDGVIYKYDRGNGLGEYVVFESNQVKNVDNLNPTENPDIRYSLSDNQGRELSEGQQEYFKDSKIRDENGNLMTMYHGTPNKGFTEFFVNSYFTPNKDYATRYTNTGASSISYGKTSSSPGVYEVYLNMTNPFDLDNSKCREIYYNFIKKGNSAYISPYTSQQELDAIKQVDWLEGQDFAEYLKENHPEYDGLIVDEGADGGYGQEVIERGNGYIIFNPNQVKNVDNLNPTDNPDIRYSLSDNQGRELSEGQQEYFKGSKAVDENGNLKVLYHGTPNEFSKFSYEHLGTNGTLLGKGFYLTDDINVAQAYANKGENGKVMELYADIKKPLKWGETSISKQQYKNFVEAINEATEGRLFADYSGEFYEKGSKEYNSTLNDILMDYEYGGDDIDLVSGILNATGMAWDKGYKILKDTTGYDGIIVTTDVYDSGEGNVYIPFQSYQIKNIDNINPTTNDDIQYSLSEELDNYLESNKFTLETNGSMSYETLTNKQITSLASAYKKNGYTDVTSDYLKSKINNSIRFKIPRQVADTFIEKELGYKPQIDTTQVYEDAEGNPLTKEQVEFYKNSDIRDIRGRLIPVYHRTDADFTIFDDKAGKKHGSKYGKGFYFSITPENYGNRTIKAYLNSREGEYKYIPSKGYYVVQTKNQIKSVDNLNPTENDDINLSMSEQGEGNNNRLLPTLDNTKLSDTKLVEENLPIAEETKTKSKGKMVQKAIDGFYDEEIGTPTRKQIIDNNRMLARKQLGDILQIKDKKKGIQYQINTMKRNLRDIMPKEQAAEMYDTYFKPITENNAEAEKFITSYNERIQKYNINNEESTYIQMIGEKKYNPESTLTDIEIENFYNKNRNKIDQAKCEKAADEFRNIYDELIGQINDTLVQNGYNPIEYRKGYFPHFIEEKATSPIGKLAEKLGWKIKQGTLPTDIAGITDQFKPGKVWTSFSQQRTGDATDYNALKGLDNYLRGATDTIFHTNDIQKLRALENEIRYQFSDKGVQEKIDNIYNDESLDVEEKNEAIYNLTKSMKDSMGLGNFATEIRNYTDNLANKKAFGDRSMEQAFGRDTYSIMQNINSRISANMVGANISSALTNFIPITQAWSQTSTKNLMRGMYESIRNTIKNDGFEDGSTFLINRTQKAERLYQTGLDKINNKLGIPFEAVDSFTSNTIVRAKYYDNIEAGMSEAKAMDNANEFAKDVMAGRSKGDMPTIFNQKNPMVKLLTAFQLEVNNQYGYMFKDVPTDLGDEAKEKLVGAFIKMFLGAFIYNYFSEMITGRKSAFSPIDMAIDDIKTLSNENMDFGEKISAIAKDTAQELPFVGGIMGGGRLPIQSAIPYENPLEMVTETLSDASKLFDEDAATKKTAINNLLKEWSKPVYYVLMPFAGGQIKKTIEGLSMYDENLPIAGSYTSSGKLRFEADTSMLGKLQAAVFGQYASKNAREYFDNGYTALTENQVNVALEAGLNINQYREYKNGLKQQETTEDKVDYIYNLPLADEQKNVLVNDALNRKEDIDISNYGDYGSLAEFDYATKNPEKYATITQITDYETFTSYKEEIDDIKEQYSDSDRRKAAIRKYINSLSLNKYQKMMLEKMAAGYSIKNYRSSLYTYINSLDLSKAEKEMIDSVLFD